jgi:hypothetical protein
LRKSPTGPTLTLRWRCGANAATTPLRSACQVAALDTSILFAARCIHVSAHYTPVSQSSVHRGTRSLPSSVASRVLDHLYRTPRLLALATILPVHTYKCMDACCTGATTPRARGPASLRRLTLCLSCFDFFRFFSLLLRFLISRSGDRSQACAQSKRLCGCRWPSQGREGGHRAEYRCRDCGRVESGAF